MVALYACWLGKEEEEIRVAVCDNGKGISTQKIAELLHADLGEIETAGRVRKGHVSGIGVDNVLKRLRLFFGRDNVMEITCRGERPASY